MATRANIGQPIRVTAMGDGGFLVVNQQQKVLRVWPSGSLTEVGPELDLFDVADARPMADGSVLVADRSEVFRVAPDGTTTRLAGSSASADLGDGGPASEAAFVHIAGIAPLADGGYLVLDGADEGRLRRVRPDGFIVPFGPDVIRYGQAVTADPLGGALVSKGPLLQIEDPTVRPAPLPAPSPGGTDGYAGSCAGLDPGFSGGAVSPDLPYGITQELAGMVRQPDGRLLFGATFNGALGVLALHPDGRVDDGFGSGGLVLPPVAGDDEVWVSGIVRQSSGRLIVVGLVRGPEQVIVVGLRPDGSLDPGFAGDGVFEGGAGGP